MKKVINFFKRLFGRKYVDIRKINNLKKMGITPIF